MAFNLNGRSQDFNLLIETYSVETQEAVIDLVKQNSLPEHVWRNLLKKMLASPSSTDTPSPMSRLPGSLTPVRQNPESADLMFISQNSLKISSQCPITLRPIHTPVRGIDCKHFDVS
jgi:SUMO ligase MMS21 Smc5/6 complex component